MEEDPRGESAIIFPGISQMTFADVAKFMLINPAARALLAQTDETLGYSLIDRYRESEGGYSEFSRVAFLVSCLALANWSAEEYGLQPRLCAGPSFGGTPAAVYSGALPFTDAVWLTAQWSRCIEDYFTGQDQDLVTLSFARTPAEKLHEIMAELDGQGEWNDIACHIDEDFYMLSVRAGMLEWLHRRVRAVGGFPLDTMRPALHSSRFAPLRNRLDRELVGELHFSDPTVGVVCDHDGTILHEATEVRSMVLDAIVRPVRWPDVVAALMKQGIERVCVSGQDSLWGRVACTTRNFEVVIVSPKTALQPRRRSAIA